MRKILIIGAGSDIAKTLIQDECEFDFINLSSQENDFNILDKTTFPNINSIDGLVYFPGTINLKPFSRFSAEDFMNDYKINVFGLINALKFYQKSFNKDSSIVTISSIAANFGMPYHSSISMCKSSVEALTKSLAAEWAPEIRLNCIAPSLISTKLSNRFLNSELKTKNIENKHPLRSIGETQDVSHVISFLLSDRSKWITGQVIRVDGGISSIR